MKTRFLLLFCFAIFLVSCSSGNKNDFVDQELMIDVPASELYVRLRGNPKGDIIINLHGGPGGYSGIDIKLMGPGLEDKFLVAYLDQRGCGKSPACKKDSLLTVRQYIEDLNIVIDTLRKHYNKKQVDLIGTSWGGMYGFLYLLRHEKKVNAFACVDGKVNSQYQNKSLIDYELKRANELLNSNITKEKETNWKTSKRNWSESAKVILPIFIPMLTE